MVMVMAEIYTRCGRYDEALDEIEYMLSLECDVTPFAVENWRWTVPLRDLPRFKELMKRYAYNPTT